jgi:hypothetical protein
MFASFFKALREIHSEPGPAGTLSWARCAATVCLASSISWVSYVLVHSNPHTLIPLEGPIAFFTATYLINKGITAMQSAGPNPVGK